MTDKQVNSLIPETSKSSIAIFVGVVVVVVGLVIKSIFGSGQEVQKIKHNESQIEKLEYKIDEYHREANKKFDKQAVLLYGIKSTVDGLKK